MESPAGGSAAAEPAPPGAEAELAAGGPAEAAEAEVGSAAPRPRCLRAVYVLNDPPKAGAGARSPEAGARQCLLRACEAEGAQLSTVNFGELDFGETAVLDAFYDAGHSMARSVFALHLKGYIYHRIQNTKGSKPTIFRTGSWWMRGWAGYCAALVKCQNC